MSMGIIKNGAYNKVAGYAESGELVIGASTIRKGTFTFVKRPDSNFCDATVIFDTPMPDADYEVVISWVTVLGISMYGRVQNKTKNGFSFNGYYGDATDAAFYGNQEVAYTAFKLFTKEGLEDLENDVADLKNHEKIKIATPTLATGVTGTAQYHWQRNECTVLMQGVDVPAGFTFNADFIKNLPQAATDAVVQYGTLYVLEWNGSTWQGQRVALTNIPAGDTALKADGNIGGAANVIRVYGSFTYRTKDWYNGN